MPSDAVVRLSWEDMLTAALAGVRRQLICMQRGYRDRSVKNRDAAFDRHVLGCMSELALSRYFNLYWCAVADDVVHGGDVGGYLEARAASVKNNRQDMRIEPRDNDFRPYVLVLCDPPFFRLLGWLWGYEGKDGRGRWFEEFGCWYVPQDRLRSIDELMTVLRHHLAETSNEASTS